MLEDCTTATKEQLVVSHLRMVDSIVTKHYGKNHTLYDDLVQVGNIALINSIDNFDPTVGVSFASYAIPWIKMAIMNYALDNKHDIRVLTSKPIRKAFFNQKKYKNAEGNLDRELMSKETGVSIDDIREMESRTQKSYMTFETHDNGEEIINIPDYDSNPMNIMQYLQYEQFLERDMIDVLSTLTDRERFIIENRYYVEEPLGFQQIAPIFGVSHQRIQQIEKAAFAKMKKALANRFESCKLDA